MRRSPTASARPSWRLSIPCPLSTEEKKKKHHLIACVRDGRAPSSEDAPKEAAIAGAAREGARARARAILGARHRCRTLHPHAPDVGRSAGECRRCTIEHLSRVQEKEPSFSVEAALSFLSVAERLLRPSGLQMC
mmetsp:Transcript_11172/g.36770  ORF Transcript_11172/g.36770 Transcript_11172/m.36770 type:complete len:135 (+) Transcript_11172:1338-1742(+)